MKKTIIALSISTLIILSTTSFIFANNNTAYITIPTYSTKINNVVIDNSNSDYPLINYNNITYFPMTWNYCKALGLTISWSNITGLKLVSDGPLSPLLKDEGTVNDFYQTYNASIANFDITVNGRPIDNSIEQYPILVFRDITYFPLTWSFAVDAFKWQYLWSEDEGLSIAHGSITKDTPPIEYLEPFYIRKTTIGATREDVLGAETTVASYDKNNLLIFKNIYSESVKTRLYYYFKDDYLYKVIFNFEDSHNDKNEFIEDYLRVKESLVLDYGESSISKITWNDERLKDDPRQLGLALITGKVEYFDAWLKGNTMIFLEMSGKDYEVTTTLTYNDLSVSEEVEE